MGKVGEQGVGSVVYSVGASAPGAVAPGVVALGATALVLCALIYWPALHGPLFFDDVPNLLANNIVQIDGRSFDAWRQAAFSSNSGLFYRPLSMLSFAANHVLAGEFTAFSLKVTNLALHLGIATLVFYFARLVLATPAMQSELVRSEAKQWLALAAAVLWLLHPLQVSTVLYAVQRMAQLATLFTFVGLCLFLNIRLRWARHGASVGACIATAISLGLWTLVAMLCKENGALLPWLILVLEFTLFQGQWAGCRRPGLQWATTAALLAPLLVILAVFLVAPEFFSDRYLRREFTLEERLLTQARVLWAYVYWLVVPNVLEMGFFHDDFTLSQAFWSPRSAGIAVLSWVLVGLAALLLHRRLPLFCCAVLFFLVGHSIESSVWPLQMAFEHRNYLPAVPFLLCLAVTGWTIAQRFGPRVPAVLGSVVVVIFSLLLIVRTQVWKDDYSLARFNVINHPESPWANFYFGNALLERYGEYDGESVGQAPGGTPGGARSEDERLGLLVGARKHFEQMHTLTPRDMAPLVMLYQLDTTHFPQLALDNNWLERIETLALSRRIQASDRTALSALVDFTLTLPGELQRRRVKDLLGAIAQRHPKRTDVLPHQFRLLFNGSQQEREELGRVLRLALENARSNRKAPAYLAQYYGEDDLAATYEALRIWLKRDRMRRELSSLRAIFP